jgi:hypothetical protein
LRGAVSDTVKRLRRQLRFVAADRYRALLADEAPGRALQAVLFAAAAFDAAHTAGRRAVRARHRLAWLRQQAEIARAAQVHRGEPQIVGATVGDSARLSVQLAAAGPALDGAVLRLESPDGRVLDLATVTSAADGRTRLAADLPPSAFPSGGARWRLAVVTSNRADARAVPVVALDPGAVLTRARAGTQWPPQALVDGQRRVVLQGAADEAVSIEHGVIVGTARAIVSWPASAGLVGALRLQRAGDERALVFDAEAVGPNQCAVVDLPALAAHGPGTWLASVRTGRPGRDPEGWRALQLQRGPFPALPALATLAIRAADQVPARVRVAYSPANELTFAVGRLR